MKIPFSISVYEHAAALIGRTPWEVSRDGALVLEAHRAAYQLYRHFPVVVGIDIYNLEAEAYGCKVTQPQGTGIPAITRPLFRSLAEATDLAPLDPGKGRIPMMIEAAQQLAAEFPSAEVRLPVSGPFSLAVSLVGMEEAVMGAAVEPEQLRYLLDALVPGQLAFCENIVEAGLGVAFFESAAAPPMLSPRQFHELELPPLKDLLQAIEAITGKPAPCIMGGNTAPIVDDIMETGTRFIICPAETDRNDFLRRMEAYPEVAVRINLDPRIYTRGSRDEILQAVDEVIALAVGRPNLLLGTGSVPYETPPENILLIRDYAAS
jgi:uroporphyrinogen decarboxylase